MKRANFAKNDTAKNQSTEIIGDNAPERLAYSIEQVCAATSLGRSTVYALISEQRLRAVRVGRRTLVLASSVRLLLAEDEPS